MGLRRRDRDAQHGHPGRPRRVYLHIGGPSTGTTYLQRFLTANRAELAAVGYFLPGPWRDVVLATHDALSFGRTTAKRNDLVSAAGGRWDRLAEQLTSYDGAAALVSMEFLCWAKPPAAARIIETLADAEVHVVLTVRDSAAVLRSQWQTNCRNGEDVPLRRMIWGLRQAVRGAEPATKPERMISRAMGVPRVIETWLPLVGPDRFHVVTVPLANDDPDLLWKRFAGVVGLEPGRFREQAKETNQSLGLPSSELMRLLNLELGPVPRTDYLRTMKALLARDILGARAGRERKVTLNRQGRNLSARWNGRVREAITASGVDLVGTLDDLPLTRVGEEVPAELDAPTDEELLDAAAWARDGLVAAIADLEERLAALRADRPESTDGATVEESDAETDEETDDTGDARDGSGGVGEESDDPEDQGQDARARLERQLAERSPELGAALTGLAALVRRAIPLGAEVAALRQDRDE